MKLSLKANVFSFFSFFIMSILLIPGITSNAQGFETFDSLKIPGSSYLDSNFIGNNNIKWSYVSARSENIYPITGKGIILRGGGNYKSKLSSEAIQGGISHFSVKMRKAFTNSDKRQIALFINGDSIGGSVIFGTTADTSVHTFAIKNINRIGNITIELRCTQPGSITLDEIQWSSFPEDGASEKPVVNVENIEWISPNACKIEGSIANAGSSTVTEKGIIFGTAAILNFTTGTKKVSITENTTFSADLSNLKRNTSYYYQAYAINATDTGYSSISSFTTPNIILTDGMLETFDLLTPTSSIYKDGSFVGNNGIKWTYTNVRSDALFPIEGGGIVFRYATKNLAHTSRIISEPVDGGISDFSVKLRKASSNTGVRQVSLYINNDSIASSEKFGNFTGESDSIFTFSVTGINKSGPVSIEIRQTTGDSNSNRHLTVDNIEWTKYASVLNIATLNAEEGVAGGEIIDFGATAPTEKGFLWNTSPTITIDNSEKIMNTDQDNPFYSTIPNSNDDTIFYRAYAIDAIGIAYGQVLKLNFNAGIFNLSSANTLQLRIYPNPSKGEFIVHFEKPQNTLFEIYTSAGQLVKSFSTLKADNVKFFLERKGMYYAKIKDIHSNEIAVKKLIVQ